MDFCQIFLFLANGWIHCTQTPLLVLDSPGPKYKARLKLKALSKIFRRCSMFNYLHSIAVAIVIDCIHCFSYLKMLAISLT